VPGVRSDGLLDNERWRVYDGGVNERRGGQSVANKRDVHLVLTEEAHVKLLRIAEDAGCITTSGGPKQGAPSLGQLLEAIGSGAFVIVEAAEVPEDDQTVTPE